MEQTILQFLVTQGPMGVFAAFIFFLYDRSYKESISHERSNLEQSRIINQQLIEALIGYTRELEKLRNELERKNVPNRT